MNSHKAQNHLLLIFTVALLLLFVSLSCTPAGDRSGTRARRTPPPTPPPASATLGKELPARFLVGGWALPQKENASSPFAETLRAFVLTSEREMQVFLEGMRVGQLRGDLKSLTENDFNRSIVVAVYYLWRPVKGDPMTIDTVRLKGDEVTVEITLVDSAPGREFPFLLAPMQVVALDQDAFPRNKPLSFNFLLNGKSASVIERTIQ
jgi:hypothetical protein